MPISDFTLTPEPGDPDEQQLTLVRSPDYETPADRLQRGVLVCTRTESDSVTAKTIRRGFVLTATPVDEPPLWTPAQLPTITLQIPSDLTAVSHQADYRQAATDPENESWDLSLGTVPAGISAVQGVGEPQSKLITYTYGAQTSNPSADQTFNIPLSLLQNNVAVPNSNINQAVVVRRYAPHAISSAYSFLASPGVIGIPATGFSFTLHPQTWIQNPDNRALLMVNADNNTTSWRSPYCNYTLTQDTSGRWVWSGSRRSDFGDFFSTDQVDVVALRATTNDNGDNSSIVQHWRVQVSVP